MMRIWRLAMRRLRRRRPVIINPMAPARHRHEHVGERTAPLTLRDIERLTRQ